MKLRDSTINFITSIVTYGVSLVVGLTYTPFLVRSLGASAYDLIPVSFAIVQYFGFLSQTIGSTINQRLISSKDDENYYNEVFSTSTVLSLGLAFFVSIMLFTASFGLSHFIKVPPDLYDDTRRIFDAVAISLTIAIASTPLRGVIFSENANYWLSLSQAMETIVRVLVVVAFFLIYKPSLGFVSNGILIGTLIGLGVVFYAARRLRPSLHLSREGINLKLARGMFLTSGGVLMTQGGTLLLLGTDLVIMNIVYGAQIGGVYAAVSQWAVVLRGLTLSVASAITAHIMQIYHSGDSERIRDAVCQSIRLLTAFASLPTGYIAGVSPYLLSVWLGPHYAQYWLLLVALVLPLAFNIVAIPLLAITLAANMTYRMGIVHMVAGIGFVAAAFGSAWLLHWGGAEVALSLGLALVLKNWLSVIPFAAEVAGVSPGPFLKASITPLIWVSISTSITGTLAYFLRPETYFSLFGIGFLASVIYVIIWFKIAPPEDSGLANTEIITMIQLLRRRGLTFVGRVS